jgi:branched-chain amino acid transport system ATP-binding protein
MAEAAVTTKSDGRRPRSAAAEVSNLEGWYGESHVLHGISFDVKPGEVVTLLGRNGAGKSTTLKALMGILTKRKGSVTFDGHQTIGLPARAIAKLGMGYVPEERGIFPRSRSRRT